MSGITPEELAAFADGELAEPRQREVAALVAADPDLMTQVEAHRALRARLGAHFAPIFDAPLPESLTAALARPPADIVDFAAAREKRRQLPKRWGWIAGPALAASLVLGLFVTRGGGDGEYAGTQLAAVLDTQLVANQPGDAPVKVLLSFRDKGGSYCRAFSGEETSGIACRDEEGWRLQSLGAGGGGQDTEYQMAGSDAAKVMERAQDMASGPALDSAGEEAARKKGWR